MAHQRLGSSQNSKNSEDGLSDSRDKAVFVARRSVWAVVLSWWFECACAAVMVGALFALACVLTTYQGRSLPHWPFGVSINSLVAVSMVVLKGMMLLIIAEGRSPEVTFITSDLSYQA